MPSAARIGIRNGRRWLLYRLMEKERLDSEQTRRLAEYLAHEGLSMYVTDSDHQYNCASLLEVGQIDTKPVDPVQTAF